MSVRGALYLVLLAACRPAVTIPEDQVSAVIDADGGSLTSADGLATLVIPPGALSAATTLTVHSLDADGTASRVYDFGPDGLDFSQPATLSISGSAVGDGEQLVVAVSDGSGWVDLPGVSLDGAAMGLVDGFSRFSLIIRGGMVVAQSECPDVAASFASCGGDPTGQWTATRFCFEDLAIGADPFRGACPTASVRVDLPLEASMQLGDGVLELDWDTMALTATLEVPKVCLPRVDLAGTRLACSRLGSRCADAGDRCDCTFRGAVEAGALEDTYTIVGDEIDASDLGAIPYCVDGDALVGQVATPSALAPVFFGGLGPITLELERIPVEICGNGLDDDRDGDADCGDPDCADDAYCVDAVPENCANGLDDDKDAVSDCDDRDCACNGRCVEAWLPSSSFDNLLGNPGFEDTASPPRIGWWPDSAGAWGRDSAVLSTDSGDGVVPYEGTQMLRFVYTTAGSPGGSSGCEIFQVADATPFKGERLCFASRFARVDGAPDVIDTAFQSRIMVWGGGLGDFQAQWSGGLATGCGTTEWCAQEWVSAATPNDWYIAATPIDVPSSVGTMSVAVQISAVENVRNDDVDPEFDGHYADDAWLFVLPKAKP